MKTNDIKNKKDKIIKKGNYFCNEFKDFISRGNVLDMAVGVIVGSAFGKIVTSLVDNILMPLIGVIIGGYDFSNLAIKVGNAQIKYGIFIQNIIDFLIVALCLFIVVKTLNRLNEKVKKEKQEKENKEVKIDENLVVLKEIRDLLKKNK